MTLPQLPIAKKKKKKLKCKRFRGHESYLSISEGKAQRPHVVSESTGELILLNES